MFDELKEVKYFREITGFKSLNLRHIKEIKHLKSLEKAEAYLEPKRASTMEFFFGMDLMAYYFRNKSSVIDIRLGSIKIYENIEIFNVKLRLSKTSRLLERVAFLISDFFPIF